MSVAPVQTRRLRRPAVVMVWTLALGIPLGNGAGLWIRQRAEPGR